MLNNEQIIFKITEIGIPYEAMEKEPFRKYGIYIDGVYPKWEWFTADNITPAGVANGRKPVAEATREELLEMLAICAVHSAELYRGIVRRIEKAGVEWWKLPDNE